MKAFQTPAPHITRADRPAADMQALVARQKVQARTERLREILAHPEIAEKTASRGDLFEYRHLLHDADPDSTIPVFRVNLTKRPQEAS